MLRIKIFYVLLLFRLRFKNLFLFLTKYLSLVFSYVLSVLFFFFLFVNTIYVFSSQTNGKIGGQFFVLQLVSASVNCSFFCFVCALFCFCLLYSSLLFVFFFLAFAKKALYL